jgi:asparagine synthase (glutamine-hydrolysing)
MLHHRGPDHSDYKVINNQKRFIGFGHSRLAIIDLEKRSNQPFEYKNRYMIVFNGEIYNYKELKIDLEKKGYKFETASDTEVLIASYDAYKDNMYDHLDGMFAFSIYDKFKNKLIIARDHLGIKPVYYFLNQDKKSVFFSSELKSLFNFKEVKKEIDPYMIGEFLFNGWLYEPDTGFKEVQKIFPGSFIKIDLKSNKIEHVKYFDVKNENKLKKFVKNKSIKKLIDDSIKLQCNSDVKLGAFFSGGIDSTVIVNNVKNIECLSAKYKEQDLKQGGIGNDFYYSKLIQKKLDLKVSKVEVEKDEYSIDSLKSITMKNEELNSDFTYSISEKIAFAAKHKNFKVMLSGMGADELFGGYPRYKAIKYKKVFQILGFFGKAFLPFFQNFNSLNKKIERFYTFLREKDFIFSYSSLIGVFSKNEIKNFLIDKKSIEFFHNKISSLLHGADHLTTYKKAFYLDLYGFLSHNFSVTDKSSMQASIEVRVPLVNKFIAVKNFHEKDENLLNLFKTKIQLKNILDNILSKEIINRKKTGFNPPLDPLINNLSKQKIIEYFESGSLKKYIILDKVYLLVNDHFDNKKNNIYKIYQLLYLHFWIEANEN